MALYEINPNAMRGSGTYFLGRAGEALGRAKLVYKHANGAWYLADADLVAEMPVIGLTMDRVNAGQIVRVMKEGFIGRADWAWTVGTEMYASSTPGELVQAPAGITQIVGMATQPNLIYFEPEGTGAGGVVCALLEGHTAYVGFDVCKGANYTNYFTVDGTADDVQINAAIVYVNGLGGGTVFIERGTYDITASVVMLTGVWLFGAGHDTILDAAVGLADHVIKEENALYFTDWQVADLAIVGTGQTAGAGIRAYRDYRVKIKNVYIYDTFADGIDASTVQHIEVDGCFIYNTGSSGIVIYGNIDHRAVITNNHVIEPTLNGIQFYYDVANHGDSHSVVDGNVVIGINNEDTNQRGINFQRCSHPTISNNTVNKFRLGIYFSEVYDAVIEGNTLTDNGWDGASSGAGMWLEAGCTRVTISGNIVNDNTPSAPGINISNGGGTDIIVDSNICVGNGGAGIRTITGHVTITNNICKNNNQSGLGATNDSGINLADDASYCIVTGNWCYDDQTGVETQIIGIRESGAADYNHIYHNRLSGNVTQQVVILGANTQVPEFFIPISDPNTTLGDHPAVDMPDNTDTNVYSQISFPLEFQELVTAQVIVVSAASGNMVWTVATDFGKLCATEDYNTHSDTGGATTALTLNDLECLDMSAAFTAIAAGDLVGVNFMRDGDSGSDTIGDSVYYLGIRLRYV